MVWFKTSTILFALGFIGCGKKTKSETPLDTNAIFKEVKISKEELSGGNIPTLSDTEVKGEVQAISSIYLNDPNDAGPKANDSCFTTELNKAILSATKSSIKIIVSGNVNPANCKDGTTSLKYNYSWIIACSSGDLSEWDGKSLQYFSSASKKLCDDKTEGFSLSKMNIDLESNYDGVSYVLRMLSTSSNEDGSPCKTLVDGNNNSTDGCLDFDKTEAVKVTDSTGKILDISGKIIRYQKVKQNNVKWTNEGNPKFYQSGTLDLTISNWSGTLQYVGQDTAPIWSLSNGSQEISGTFVGSSKLSSEINQPQNKIPVMPKIRFL